MKSLRAFQMVEYVNERKFCSLADLMARFDVSVATVHRDIGALVKTGRLRKVHGGVAALDAGERTPEPAADADARDHYRQRLAVRRDAKQVIARRALADIRDGDIIFLDSSTTVYHLVEALRQAAFASLTLVTNSVLIIEAFPRFPPSYFLVGLGGNYDIQLNAFLGQATLRELDRLAIDKAFVSALAVDADGLYSRHENHALFLGEALRRSRRNYLLADAGKFDKSGLFRIAPLSAIHQVISDGPPPAYLPGGDNA